jgi:hypothetical protein
MLEEWQNIITYLGLDNPIKTSVPDSAFVKIKLDNCCMKLLRLNKETEKYCFIKKHQFFFCG